MPEHMQHDPDAYKGGLKHQGTLLDYLWGEVYGCFKAGRSIISNAHKLRNANPLSHASSELLDSNSTSDDLCQCIKELSMLIYGYINKHK